MFIYIGIEGTKQELKHLDTVYMGGPCFICAANDSTFLQTLDTVYLGGPLMAYARG